MVTGFDAIQGIGASVTGSMTGTYTIAAIFLVLAVVVVMAWLGANLVINLAVSGSLAIGLAFAGWFPQSYGAGHISTVSIVMVIVALVLATFFISWINR